LRAAAAALALAGAFCSLPTPAQSGAFSKSPKVTLRLSSASPAGMDDSKAIVEAAGRLSKATGGTVTLQPFFASSLFDEIAGMGAAQSGLVDMAIACTCNMTKQTNSMLFSDLPYLWREMDNGRQVWGGPLGQKIRQEITDKLGLVPLAFAPSGGGYRLLWNNRRVIKVPADAKGLKIRTVATPVEQDFWRRMGAIPTPVDIGETYSALQQGLVDGQHLQPAWLNLLKHDEVVKYGTEIGALAVYRILVVNQKSLARLDDAQRKAFLEAMKFMEDRAYFHNRAMRESSLQAIRAKGVQIYTPTPAEMAEWRKLGQDMYQADVVKNSVPPATIEQVIALQK
jgi:TRAP-type C4-dicarboxylate transport system substrate-binding protein